MTVETREKAAALALQAKKSTSNSNIWFVRVWENLGWYWSLRCADWLEVYPVHREGEKPVYTYLLSDGRGTGYGAGFWPNVQQKKSFDSPDECLFYAIANAGIFKYQINKVLTDLLKASNDLRKRKKI